MSRDGVDETGAVRATAGLSGRGRIGDEQTGDGDEAEAETRRAGPPSNEEAGEDPGGEDVEGWVGDGDARRDDVAAEADGRFDREDPDDEPRGDDEDRALDEPGRRRPAPVAVSDGEEKDPRAGQVRDVGS